MNALRIRSFAMTASAAVTAAGMIGMLPVHAADKRQPDKGHWSYSGKTGPAKWAELEKDFAECKLGQTQSPIDIPDATARKGDFPTLLFNYKPSAVRVVDNGHTIQANYDPGSSFAVGDSRYELLQFHFHKPSEEKINGRAHDMVAHMVHKGADGKLAVLAVLLDAGNKPNPVVKAVMDNVPKEKGKEVASNAKINAADLLPNDKGYYSFAGSLTTPPCSESVTWYVFKTPTTVSPDTLARFGKMYPMNARPVQPLNGRDIIATR